MTMSWPRTPGAPIIHVHRVCDDPEVQRFVEAEMLNFLSTTVKLTADQMIDAACKRFGRIRCEGLGIWDH